MRTLLLPLLLVVFLYVPGPMCLFAQAPLFERLGDVITRADRDYFGLFPRAPDFAEAHIQAGPDASVVLLLDRDGKSQILLDSMQAEALRRYTARFESLIEDSTFEMAGSELHGLVRPRRPYHPARRIALSKRDGSRMRVTAVYIDPAGIVYLDQAAHVAWPAVDAALQFIPVGDIRSVRTGFFHMRDVHGDSEAFRETVLPLIKRNAYFYGAPPPEISRRFPVVYDAQVADTSAFSTAALQVVWDGNYPPGTRRPAPALSPRRIAIGLLWLSPTTPMPVVQAQAYDANHSTKVRSQKPGASYGVAATYRISRNDKAGAYVSVLSRQRIAEDSSGDHFTTGAAMLSLTYERILAREETRTPFIFEWIAGVGPSLARVEVASRLYYNRDFFADDEQVTTRPGVFATTYVSVTLTTGLGFRGGVSASTTPPVTVGAREVVSPLRPLVLKQSQPQRFAWRVFSPFVGVALRM